MPFPDVTRVIYDKNPLVNVICQFRFPPILKIDSEVPASFQEKIRNKFPLYLEKREYIQQLLPQNISGLANQLLAKQATGKNHEFSTEDNVWKINVTKTFITLSTSEYKKWEDFIENFKFAINAFNEIYAPQFFNRIGLRYIDVFNRTELELQGTNWNELIKPEFLGLLSTAYADKVQGFESIYEIKLEDNISLVRMIASIVKEPKTNEDCFMVDSDFHNIQKNDLQKAFAILEFLHQRASRLMRCIIQDKLHEALKPEVVK